MAGGGRWAGGEGERREQRRQQRRVHALCGDGEEGDAQRDGGGDGVGRRSMWRLLGGACAACLIWACAAGLLL